MSAATASLARPRGWPTLRTIAPTNVTRIDPSPEDRWQQVYRAERSALLGFLRKQVRDEATAEDLVQETFVRAIRSGRAGEEPERLRSYLFTIAGNLAIDHWRRRPPVALSLDAGATDDAPAMEIEDVAAESPESAARRRGLARRVSEALALLPERYATAFRLAAIEQRSYKEIGASTGWSLDQVRVNVHRARRRLIEALGDQLA